MRHIRLAALLCLSATFLLAQSAVSQDLQNIPIWVHNPVNGLQYSNPPTWPIAAQRSRFVYDPVLQKTLYPARRTGCNHYNDSLWAYDLAKNKFTMMSWSGSFPEPQNCNDGSPAKDTPTYPSDRYDRTLTYDSLRSRLVVYSDDCMTPDMYHWFSSEPPYPNTPAGMGWAADCNPCAPGSVVDGSLTYTDTSYDIIVMFGGTNSGAMYGDTWEYLGFANTWSRIATKCVGPGCTSCGTGCSNLGQRAFETMVYDPLNRKVVLFGGVNRYYGTQNDTWEYDLDSHTWTNWNPPIKPPAMKYPPMDFDSTRGILWLHTGIVGQDCSAGCDWTYSVATHKWTKQPITGGPFPEGPISQNSQFMGYDPHCDALVASAKHTNIVEELTMWYLPLSGTLTCTE